MLVLCKVGLPGDLKNSVDHRLIARIGGRKWSVLWSRADRCKFCEEEGVLMSVVSAEALMDVQPIAWLRHRGTGQQHTQVRLTLREDLFSEWVAYADDYRTSWSLQNVDPRLSLTEN